MNLLQLQQEIGRLLNDPSNSRWTADVLTSRINLAQIEVQGFTAAVKTITTNDIMVGVPYISTNQTLIDVLSVQVTYANGEVHPLTGITLEELNFRYPNWLQWSPGQPSLFIFNASDRIIQVLPAPNYSYTNGYIVRSSEQPTELSSASDIPFRAYTPMYPYHMSIVHWVVAQCWMDDGTPESLGKATFHKSGDMMHPGQYELQLARITSTFDAPEVVSSRIMAQPQGGRIGTWFIPNKSNPFDF